ncbi:MAG: tungsten ABC transporter substrate-binding protein, partial [Comamonadaceae bacterium]
MKLNAFFKGNRAAVRAGWALVATVLIAGTASAQSITMASTTSTEQSGLFTYLLPEFKKASGLDVKVVA